MTQNSLKNNNWENFLIDASSDIRRLDYVYRFSSIPVVMKEQVSTHSFWVALYSAMIHSEMNGPGDLTKFILSYALVHDASEARSGDFVRTFKYSSKELKEAINKGEKAMMDSLPSRIKNMFDLPNHLSSTEKAYIYHIIKAADFLSLQQFMLREWNKGNTEIKCFYMRMLDDLTIMSEDVAEVDFDDKSFNKYVPLLVEFYKTLVVGCNSHFTV